MASSAPLPPLNRRPVSATISPRYRPMPKHLNRCLQAADIRHAPSLQSLVRGVVTPESPHQDARTLNSSWEDPSSAPLKAGPSASQPHSDAFDTVITSLVLEYGSILYAPLGQVEAAYEACYEGNVSSDERARRCSGVNTKGEFILTQHSRNAIQAAEKAATAITARREEHKQRPLTAKENTRRRVHYVPPPTIYTPRPATQKRSIGSTTKRQQACPFPDGTVGHALATANETLPANAAATSPRRPRDVKSALGPYLRRPIAGQEFHIKASKDEVLNLRRVLNEVQLHIPALARLQAQKKSNLETEEAQAQCFMDIFAIIDEDSSGEIDEQEFVAFGQRIGGETAKVFSKRLFYRLVKPEHRQQGGGIGLEPMLELLFPNFMRQKKAQEAAAEEKRREVTTMPAHWQDTFDARDIEELYTTFKEIDRDGNGSISAEELALYCEGPMALVAPKHGGTAALARYEQHLKAFDINGDGHIDFKEFAEMQKHYLDSTRGKKGHGGSEVRATLGGIQPPQWLPYFD